MDEPRASAEAIIDDDFREQEANQRNGELTMFTCPDCGGTLWQVDSGPVTRFRCHVGHTYASEALIGLKSEEVEAALWSSVRMLRERATLTRQVAQQLRLTRQTGRRVDSLDDKAVLDERRAEVILDLLRAPVMPIEDADA
jgi:two-component system chemotaxis response regulator CheB